jgi:hypothetical protein
VLPRRPDDPVSLGAARAAAEGVADGVVGGARDPLPLGPRRPSPETAHPGRSDALVETGARDAHTAADVTRGGSRARAQAVSTPERLSPPRESATASQRADGGHASTVGAPPGTVLRWIALLAASMGIAGLVAAVRRAAATTARTRGAALARA